jgi:hypothetical protein
VDRAGPNRDHPVSNRPGQPSQSAAPRIQFTKPQPLGPRSYVVELNITVPLVIVSSVQAMGDRFKGETGRDMRITSGERTVYAHRLRSSTS